MAGRKKQNRLKDEIAEEELKKKNGLMRIGAAILIFIAVTAVKQVLVLSGSEFASHMLVNAVFYIFALVMAGVAGFGSRDYLQAKSRIKELEGKFKK